MIIKPTTGIDNFIFGMLPNDVLKKYGKPDKEFKDDEENCIYQYNALKVKLTFYKEEDFKLGYISCTHPSLSLFNEKVIGENIDSFKKIAQNQKIIKWELEDFESFDNYFNEDNWINLHVEYDEIFRIELGAIIKNDEFVWKF